MLSVVAMATSSLRNVDLEYQPSSAKTFPDNLISVYDGAQVCLETDKRKSN